MGSPSPLRPDAALRGLRSAGDPVLAAIVWERAGSRLDEEFEFALDWDLLLRFLDLGANFVRLPRYLGAFRIHDETKTVTRTDDVGRAEVARLRRRVHGRAVSEVEAGLATRAYKRKHVCVHTAHRLLERLPLPRAEVRPGDAAA